MRMKDQILVDEWSRCGYRCSANANSSLYDFIHIPQQSND